MPHRLLTVQAQNLPPGFSGEDLELVKRLYTDGFLTPINSDNVPASHGVILIACADGRRFPNVFHHFEIELAHSKKKKKEPIIHTLCCAGAALRLAKSSPVMPMRRADSFWLEEIIFAAKNLGLETVLTVTHWPCGAALHSNVTLLESFRVFAKGKERIRRLQPPLAVYGYLDLDLGVEQITYRLTGRGLEGHLRKLGYSM